LENPRKSKKTTTQGFILGKTGKIERVVKFYGNQSIPDIRKIGPLSKVLPHIQSRDVGAILKESPIIKFCP
jgi:hypothetical protein